jgi:hypothetical protein
LQALKAIRKRIVDLYAEKIGSPAAELEYQFVINRLWMSVTGLVAVALGFIAQRLGNLVLGSVSILAAVLMFALLARGFRIRHKFFQAVSIELNTHVNALHPVRGLPNWRRQLSQERLDQLNAQFNAWCEKKGIEGRRDSSKP